MKIEEVKSTIKTQRISAHTHVKGEYKVRLTFYTSVRFPLVCTNKEDLFLILKTTIFCQKGST